MGISQTRGNTSFRCASIGRSRSRLPDGIWTPRTTVEAGCNRRSGCALHPQTTPNKAPAKNIEYTEYTGYKGGFAQYSHPPCEGDHDARGGLQLSGRFGRNRSHRSLRLPERKVAGNNSAQATDDRSVARRDNADSHRDQRSDRNRNG